MRKFYADLHIHSPWSISTSKRNTLDQLALWGGRKGLHVLGTGDFTHPKWLHDIKNHLETTESGLFQLKNQKLVQDLPKKCQKLPLFMLQTEVCTIYKKKGKTRKIHHIIYMPTLKNVSLLNKNLSSYGKLDSDGRPIIKLDSRNLLDIVLKNNGTLIPAHIWTPWFGLLGSKSGFDSIDECYEDLTPHIFAVETGLSSDPPMNRRLSALDRFQLVSNSDAHSPEKLGRKATWFTCDLSYTSMLQALKNNQCGTVEIFPETGKYFFDGHRKCQFSCAHGTLCPKCHKPLIQGVVHRLEELANRKHGKAQNYEYHVPLLDLLALINNTKSTTKKVFNQYQQLLEEIGSELYILHHAKKSEFSHWKELFSIIQRIKNEKVEKVAGYDGQYGHIVF